MLAVLMMLAGCGGRDRGPAWPSLAPRPGEAMPMVVRRMATSACRQAEPSAASADCAANVPGLPSPGQPPSPAQTAPAAQLEAAVVALEADVGAAETLLRAAAARAPVEQQGNDPAPGSAAAAVVAIAAAQVQLARASIAGIAIRAAEVEQLLRDNPAGAPLLPRLAALTARLQALDVP
jgi:hypothetical protein